MKILVLSDTHIGAGYDHRKDALLDTDRVLDQIVELAKDCDLVLHGGDVFHRSKPTPAELHVFKAFCRQLERARVPMVALLGNGNHEAAADERSALELFASDWVHVSRRPEIVDRWAGVSVVTLPAVPLGRLIAGGGTDRGEASELAVDLLLQTARDLFDACDPEKPRILLAHWAISGASLPTGLPVAQLHEAVIPLDALEEIGFDATIAGHIHNADLFGDHTLYCGSPMTLDFGEKDVEHGCWIIDPDGSFEFIRLADRRFVTVEADLTIDPDEDPTETLAYEIKLAGDLTDAVVRLRYWGSEEQHRQVDQGALTRMIETGGARLYGGCQWIPVRESRARVELSEDQSPLSMLDLWISAQGLSGSEGDSLRALTERLLATL